MCSTANVGNPPHRGSFSLLSRRIDDMAGRGGDHPMSSEELSEKFDDCARRALPKQDIMPLFERLETLEKVADIRDVTRLLVKRPLPGTVTQAAKPSAARPKGIRCWKRAGFLKPSGSSRRDVAPEPLAPILAPKNVSRSTFFEFYGDRGYDAMALPGTVLRGGDLGSRNPQKAVCRFLQSKCGLTVQFAADSPVERAV
jgi:hypothetical protein